MSNNFTPDDDNIVDFQELLDSLPGLSSEVSGKRGGGGRKSTINIGADDLGVTMLEDLVKNYKVDLLKKENIKANFLYGIIDRNSELRAGQRDKEADKLSYRQTGVLAFSIARSASGNVFIQLWRGTIASGVLYFQKMFPAGKDYRYGTNEKGLVSFWRTNKKGEKFSFGELGTFVDFEVYLNAIVEFAKVPVAFPDGEVAKMQNLSEILANVNFDVELSEVQISELASTEIEDEEEVEDE